MVEDMNEIVWKQNRGFAPSKLPVVDCRNEISLAVPQHNPAVQFLCIHLLRIVGLSCSTSAQNVKKV